MKTSKGASAVEFAIVLPILILVLFGIIEGSILLYDRVMITNASREGARAGIVFQVPSVTDGDITTTVNNYLGSRLVTFGGTGVATTLVTRTGYNSGDKLTVSVEFTYVSLLLPNFLLPTPEPLGQKGLKLIVETVMRME